MIVAQPEALDASPDHLRSLAQGLTGYSFDSEHGAVFGVWLLRSEGPPLFICSDSRDIVFQFEVFSLAIQTPDVLLAAMRDQRPRVEAMYAALASAGHALPALPPTPAHVEPGPIEPWPFTDWRVDVLWRFQWTISADQWSPDWADSEAGRRFGTAPTGADRGCVVAEGLLFTSQDGERLLIDQGDMPLHMVVTRDGAQIDRALVATLVFPLEHYLGGVPPKV